MFLRKKLGPENGAVFCYVNSVFAPGLDEGVGNLWRVSCFSFPWLWSLQVRADFTWDDSALRRTIS